MRLPCPHCGSSFLGVGWGVRPTFVDHGAAKGAWNGQISTCSVVCRKCLSRGPLSDSESGAWDAWNSREVVDKDNLDRHLNLCRRNLKSDRVKCCASCPFEKIIVGHEIGMTSLFAAKRKKRGP